MATNSEKLARAVRTRRLLAAASTIPVDALPETAPGPRPRVGDRVRLVNLHPPFGGLTGKHDRPDTILEAREFGGVGRNIWVRTDDAVGRTRHFACHPAWVQRVDESTGVAARTSDAPPPDRAGADSDESLLRAAAEVLGTSDDAETVRKALEWVVRGEALRELASWDLDVDEGP